MQSPLEANLESPWLTRALAIFIVVLAAVHLYVPPGRVTELEVVPDSVEYAVAGHRFATSGQYEIQVNGQALPPRYPPGFSVLFLAPIYAVAPENIGNGIFAVWLAGILAALFAYLIGNKLAGPWAGVLAAILLLHQQQFVAYTQVIMTDVPAVALGLIACWLYLKIASEPEPKTRLYLFAGVVAALSVSIRPLTGLLVLPFLFDIFVRRGRGIWLRLIAIGFPCALALAGTGLQQFHAFGDWRRTGYQFWLAVPYDYARLTFSPRYLKDNFEIIRFDPAIRLTLLLGLLGAVALWKRRSAAFGPVALFILLVAIPLSLAHLLYFFRDIRFHFLTLSFALILAGAGFAALIPEEHRRRLWPALPIFALTILVPRIVEHPLEEGSPIRDRVATAAAQVLPQNAILISRIDPAYLEERVARGTARQILPLDRKTPYANAVLVWKRIADPSPAPRNAADHACLGLVHGGGQQLYEKTADEETEQIRAWVRAGVPVYMELLSTGADEPSRASMSAAFALVADSPERPWLMRLMLAPK